MVNPLEKFFPTLGKKTAFAVIIVFIVAGGTFVYFAHRTGYMMLEKHAQAKAHGIAEFGKAILEHDMLTGRNEELQNALERAVASDQATDIFILKSDGSIILEANTGQHFEKLPIERFKELLQFPGDRFLSLKENGSLYEFVITPIIKKPECYRCHPETEPTRGYLAVKISMDDIRATSLEHRTINIFMTIITFVGLGGIIYVTLFFLVIRPVRSLHNQMAKVENQVDHYGQGEQVYLSELEVPRSRDEIAGLLLAFNKLIRRLNGTHSKLHEMHQAQLEQADRLATTGEMAASIAHEIKNPIAGVMGALQVFDSEISNDDVRKDIITEMMVQLERINHAVNDLLSYARPKPPVFEEVKVSDLIQKTISLVSLQIKGKDITINTKLRDGDAIVSADKKQFQQVLWNIILNGLQAMETTGVLTVSMYRENSIIKIQISDTGKGIPVNLLARIFKPFFTTKHKGTGLGMTISKRIIEQHKGSISVESEEGKGTTVTIEIPQH